MLKANAQTRSRRWALGAAIAPAVAVLTSAWLALWPSFVRSESVSVGTDGTVERQVGSGSLLEAEGAGILIVLAVPVVLTAVGALSAYRGRRWPTWIVTGLLLAVCLLGAASIGLFYFPTLLALLLTAALGTAQPAGESAG